MCPPLRPRSSVFSEEPLIEGAAHWKKNQSGPRSVRPDSIQRISYVTSPIREDVVDPHSFEDVAARSFNKAERVRVGEGEGGGGEARQGQTETRSVGR